MDANDKAEAPDVHTFETGAVRSTDCDRTDYHLISPIAMRRLAEVCAEGRIKYSAYNWEKVMPITSILSHAIDHIYKYLSGDRSEDHLGHGFWNLMAAIHSEVMWPELNAETLRTEGCIPPGYGPKEEVGVTSTRSVAEILVDRGFSIQDFERAMEAAKAKDPATSSLGDTDDKPQPAPRKLHKPPTLRHVHPSAAPVDNVDYDDD